MNSCKRALVALFDAVSAVVVALLLCPGLAQPAYAYVDPSVMTYTIQALAGVAVALSAVAGVAFRRTRKALLKALHIDENARKQADARWVRVPADEANLARSAADFDLPGADAPGSGGAKAGRAREQAPARDAQDDLPWPKRFGFGLLVAGFCSFTVLFVAPLEIVASGKDDLIFGITVIWWIMALFAGAVAVAAALLLSLFRGRAFTGALVIVFCLGLCCYLQSMFMNGGMPATDARWFNWGDYKVITLVTGLIWLAVIIVPFELSKRNRGAARMAASAVAAALIVVQGVAVGSLFAEDARVPEDAGEGGVTAKDYTLTQKDMFTVSPGRNVIVFVLDTYDTVDMTRVLEDEPEFAQQLAGFTWFRDSVGSLSPTRYGLPFLLTGQYPAADEPFEQFVAERYLRSSYIGDIYDAGYSIGVYTDSLGDQYLSDADKRNVIYDKTVNIRVSDRDPADFLNVRGTLKELVKCAFYRDFPWVAKPFVYFYTDEMNQVMVSAEYAEGDPEDFPYLMDDAAWFASLKQAGLSFEEHGGNGAFRFIHLSGTHVPYNIDENGEAASLDGTDLRRQARGSLRMVVAYLDQLKQLGVYDDATIIITADHGTWWESEVGDFDWAGSPLVLAKPAGAPRADLQVSDADVDAYDVLPTVIDAVTGDAGAYGPTLFEWGDDTGRDRRYYLMHCFRNVDLALVEYRIVGDPTSLGSWLPTGNVWDPSGVAR